MNKAKIIGVAGGIGSGKSTICSELSRRGYAVYNSDINARYIIDTNVEIRQKLNELFGKNVFLHSGLDRKLVAKIVFSDAKLLQAMNAIVHPAVRQDILSWARQHDDQTYIFVESAILFESRFNVICDKVVWVTAPENIRINRTMLRDNTTEEAVRQRIHNQNNEAENQQLADIVLHNDGQIAVKCLVDSLLEQL